MNPVDEWFIPSFPFILLNLLTVCPPSLTNSPRPAPPNPATPPRPLGATTQGLSYDEETGHFYVVEEVVEQGDTHLHPVAQARRGRARARAPPAAGSGLGARRTGRGAPRRERRVARVRPAPRCPLRLSVSLLTPSPRPPSSHA
jgi:hypothetical protein